MKYLGIDYGTKKVGVAISDEDGTFAFPKAIIVAGDALETIAQICTDEKVAAIVIGESVASNGAANELASGANVFKAKLAIATSLPVYLQREDYSSVEAHRYQEKKGDRDDSAAAIILQRFLDKQKK